MPFDNDLHLRVTVTSSDGQTAEAYHTTINLDAIYDPTDPPEPLLRENLNIPQDTTVESKHEDQSPFAINIYPNPVKEMSTISYFVPEGETTVIVNILDINGRTIRSFNYHKQKRGQYYITFDAKGIKSGIYFCQINMGDQKSIQTFNKNHPDSIIIIATVTNAMGYLREELVIFYLPIKIGTYALFSNAGVKGNLAVAGYATLSNDGDVVEDRFIVLESEDNLFEFPAV